MRVCLQITTGSDVYSFGVLLWTSYTGQHPCMRKGGEWVRNPRFPGFHDCMSADPCHAQYRHLVECCLHPDPHLRPTFNEVASSLTFILGQEPSPGPAPILDHGPWSGLTQPDDASPGGPEAVAAGAAGGPQHPPTQGNEPCPLQHATASPSTPPVAGVPAAAADAGATVSGPDSAARVKEEQAASWHYHTSRSLLASCLRQRAKQAAAAGGMAGGDHAPGQPRSPGLFVPLSCGPQP